MPDPATGEHHMKRIFVLLLTGVVAVMPAPARADDPAPPRQTLHILQDMMSAVADTVFAVPAATQNASVRTTIQPPAHAWFLEQSVHTSARAHGLVPAESAAPQYDVRFGIEQIGVIYEDTRRTWIFGEQVMDRTVRLAGTVKLVEQETGTILLSRPFTTAVRDTVPVVGIEALESPGIPATHGVAPASGLFSSLVEPIVLVGSVAVAVYLLFSVRN
jgi:hypothetical protein